MKQRSRSGLALCITLIGLLQACRPEPAASAETPAAAPASAALSKGATDDSPEALMREVFAGWTPAKAFSTTVPSSDPKAGADADVLVTPTLVVTLDADHRVLVVTGAPDDGTGYAASGHIVSANVGLYGFTRRDGRWFKAFEQPSLTWTGFNGEPGSIKAQPLSAGRAALAIENGSCWQGYCGGWLEMYALDAQSATPLTSQMMASDATGATLDCEEWLAGTRPSNAEQPITADNCFSVSGTWRFEGGPDATWPDLVLHFEGKEAVNGTKANSVVVQAVKEDLVLRHGASGYEPLRGRNPARGF